MQIRNPDLFCAESAALFSLSTMSSLTFTLTRWVPDLRAASLHLSGTTERLGELLHSALTPSRISRYTPRHA